ncbi:MAG: hypothetical protein ACM3IG_06420 [Myxococcales bacterium]|jgi:hypothetical protein
MSKQIEPPEEYPHAARASELVNAILAIEQDLGRIVEMIERLIELVETSDQELVERLASCREKAVRGVRLSERLSRATRSD